MRWEAVDPEEGLRSTFFHGAFRSFDMEGHISDVTAAIFCTISQWLEQSNASKHELRVLTGLGIGT